MGYDTEYARGLSDREVLDLAERDGRVVLTRDRQLAERARANGLYITSDVLEEQLSQVAAAFGLRFDRSMTRCTLCNGELVLTTPEQVKERVPPRVLAAHDQFFVCPLCGQIYWKGSHWDDITSRLERALSPKDGSSPR
jgi:uncharacterized protein with PIN domain